MSIADPPNGQLPQAQLATFFCWLHAPVPRRPLQLFLVIGKQRWITRCFSSLIGWICGSGSCRNAGTLLPR